MTHSLFSFYTLDMSTNRKVVFANGEIYHVFNRGVEKRMTFMDKREFIRARQTLMYYQYYSPKTRFSHFLQLEKSIREDVLQRLKHTNKYAEILCYCFMPNHFHFLVKQLNEGGISKFMANFTNSYSKYFNTKHKRIGPLFQGVFKAVHISSNEQLFHVSRYIHLNPVTAFLVEAEKIEEYPWSSYINYADGGIDLLVNTQIILSSFSDKNNYKQFVLDQADYQRSLNVISPLLLDEEAV